jgi:hypothetical protein
MIKKLVGITISVAALLGTCVFIANADVLIQNSGTVPGTSVTFTGYTSPSALVTVTDSGGNVLGTTTATSSGIFSKTITSASTGSVTFNLYAEDTDSVVSSDYTAAFTIVSQVNNTESGIVIPPTISLASGDSAHVFGFAYPDSTINVYVSGSQVDTTKVNAIGKWSDVLGASKVTESISSKDDVTGQTISPFSKTVAFVPVQFTPTPTSTTTPTPTTTSTTTPTAGSTTTVTPTPGSLPNASTPSLVDSFISDLHAIKVYFEQPIPGFIATTLEIGSIFPTFIPLTDLEPLLNILFDLDELPIILLRALLLLLEYLGMRKKVRPWGVVFDSITKQPVDPVIVTLTRMDGTDTGKTQTHITDFEGKFGFLVEKGTYTLSIKKSGYMFPSTRLAGQQIDNDRENLYFGGIIHVEDANVINVNIPIDPVSFNWNQANKPIQYHPHRLAHFLKVLFFVLGLGSSIILFSIDRNFLNALFIILYPLLLIVTNLIVPKKVWGIVYDKNTMNILQGVVVKALKGDHEVVAGSFTTDHLGRYYIILNEGHYVLQVESADGTKVLRKSKPFYVHRNGTYVPPDIGI